MREKEFVDGSIREGTSGLKDRTCWVAEQGGVERRRCSRNRRCAVLCGQLESVMGPAAC